MGCSCGKNTQGRDIRDTYRIGAVLGSGSFGQVRTCVKKSTNEAFAVKIMSKYPLKEKRGSNNVDFGMMFRNEMTILSSLDHPNIVRLHEFYEDRHYLYAILDRCDGGELFSHIVKRRRFPEQEASCLCYQMLEAIQFVHQCGIVHRDIKAENFLFADKLSGSRLILIDFGMSTKVPEERPLRQLCGSPHYVAPELIRRNYRYKVDMWALGVVVFLMLYGKYPFEGPDQKAIVQAILNASPDYTSRAVSPSPLALDFMSKLLDKNVESRLCPEAALNHGWITQYTSVKEPNRRHTLADCRCDSPRRPLLVAPRKRLSDSADNRSAKSDNQQLFTSRLIRSDVNTIRKAAGEATGAFQGSEVRTRCQTTSAQQVQPSGGSDDAQSADLKEMIFPVQSLSSRSLQIQQENPSVELTEIT